MPTPTHTPLATVTISGSVNSITFSSIPATYRDLVILFGGAAASATQLSIEFNGDTGSNYSRQYLEFRGSAGAGESTDKRWIADVGSAQSNFIFQVMDYSATDKQKTALVRANDPSAIVWAAAGRWANTAAITSIKLFSGGPNFVAGSSFSIYGIAG
jgi:hypothetical protein